jgi:hypothetical protein
LISDPPSLATPPDLIIVIDFSRQYLANYLSGIVLNQESPDLCLLRGKISGVSQQGLTSVYCFKSTVLRQVLERDITGDNYQRHMTWIQNP